ncbi:MAG: carboxypeptidase-like regulatory domain-containing protein, partial [Gemmatimonadota bacterium]|nr:carboxypeptidase-like regulatory domain-containing protein [Gemmatimonadota bacterium]
MQLTMFRPAFRALCVALASLAAAESAGAQAAAPQAAGSVYGVVFDSLAGGPLAGAEVWVQGTDRTARTNEEGRYEIHDVPAGRRTLAVSHAELDSIGLTSLGGVVEVPAGGSTRLDVAAPSFARFHRAACGTDAPALSPGSGIVYGVVRDADTEQRLHGASVVLSWLVVGANAAGRLATEFPSRHVRTDDTGTYYACGVAVQTPIALQAFAGQFATGETELAIGSRRIARRDLSVGRETVVVTSDTAAPAPVAGPVVGDSADARAGTVDSVTALPTP